MIRDQVRILYLLFLWVFPTVTENEVNEFILIQQSTKTKTIYTL